MQYLTQEKAAELNLFTFSPKGKKNPDWSVDDIVEDEESWQEVRAAIINGISGNMIPEIYVEEIDKDTLVLRHDHDGRDLELDYAENCVKALESIWYGPVKLFTEVEDEEFEIS